MQNQNQLLPPTDGVIVQTNGLTITRKLSDDEVHQWYSALKAIATNIEWHLGDFLRQIESQGYDMPRVRQMELFDGANVAYVVAGAYEPQDRVTGLSYAHHRCAYEECRGNTPEAIGWLNKAQEGRMGVAELRQAIREQRMKLAESEDGPPRNATEFKALDRASLWAIKQQRQLRDYSPDKARAVLLAAKPLVDYVHTLERIALEASEQLDIQGGGRKESFIVG